LRPWLGKPGIYIRNLLDCETQSVRAAEAVALLCCQVKKWIGGLAALAEQRRNEP
jgi:hypothetical protein